MSDIETSETGQSNKLGFIKSQALRFGSAPRPHRAVASQLQPGSLNTRQWESYENRLAVVKMARSIMANTVIEDGKLVKSGVMEPIRAVNMGDDPALLDSGETRYRGVRLLEGFDLLTGATAEIGKGVLTVDLAVVPGQVPADLITFDVFYIDRKVSVTDRRFGVILANDQRPFTDLEWAAQIKALLDGDPENEIKPVPQQVIAERLGREPAWVSHINRLNTVPDAMVPYLREGQIKTTTALNMIDEFGPEDAVTHILAEIEAGKGRAAEEYQEAMVEVRAAQAEFEQIVNTGQANEPANPNATGGRRLTKGEVARRRVQTASNTAERAQRQSQNGPDRVTGRAAKERATGAKQGDDADAGKVAANRSNVDALIEAVVFVAKRSMQPTLRDQMNEVLKRVGYQPWPVAAMVDDEGNELPLPAETATVEAEAATA